MFEESVIDIDEPSSVKSADHTGYIGLVRR